MRSSQPLVGTLAVPGDKSISHRSLLLAALAEGTSTVSGLSHGDDVAATRLAVVALGAEVEAYGPMVIVHGGRSRLHAPSTWATPAPGCGCWPGWPPPCPVPPP